MTRALEEKHKNESHSFLNPDRVPLIQDGGGWKCFQDRLRLWGRIQRTPVSHQPPRSVFRQSQDTGVQWVQWGSESGHWVLSQAPTKQLCGFGQDGAYPLNSRPPSCKIRLFRLISKGSSSCDIPPLVHGSAPTFGFKGPGESDSTAVCYLGWD